MEYKDVLKELCSNLQKELNKYGAHKKVELISGLKPFDSFISQLCRGTKIISMEKELIWVVEIMLDGVCIFRKGHIPRINEDLSIVENVLMKRLLNDVFIYGVMSSKNITP